MSNKTLDEAVEAFKGGASKRKSKKPHEIAELATKVLNAVEKDHAGGLEHFTETDEPLVTGEEVLQQILAGKKIVAKKREDDETAAPEVALPGQGELPAAQEKDLRKPPTNRLSIAKKPIVETG
jgi:hypothetical protein